MERLSSGLVFSYGLVERIRCKLRSDVYDEPVIPELEVSLSTLSAAFARTYMKIHILEKRRLLPYYVMEVVGLLEQLRQLADAIENNMDVSAAKILEKEIGVLAGPYPKLPERKVLVRRSKSRSAGRITWPVLVPAVIEPLTLTDLRLQLDDARLRFESFLGTLPMDDDKMSTPDFIMPPLPLLSSSSSQYHGLWLFEDIIIGRSLEKEELITSIFSISDQHTLAFSTIEGDPGVGKTTLAKLVRNDERVQTRFDMVLWALGTRRGAILDLESIIVEIMQSSRFLPKSTEASLKCRFRDLLQGQKYILFLDDFVPKEQEIKLIELREILKVGSPGSIVIFITDSPAVTKYMGCIRSFRLRRLSEDVCWSLFIRSAEFDEQVQQNNPSLESIAKAIVNRCRGNALAIKALGCTLRNYRDEHTWNHIYNRISNSNHIYNRISNWNHIFNRISNSNHIFNCISNSHNIVSVALRISLEYMPSELIQCFVASAFFLQDKVKTRDQLLYFWMAQGLLQSNAGDEDLRDIGYMYCNQLIFSGFYQIYHSDYPCQVVIQIHNQALVLATSILTEKELRLFRERTCLFEHYMDYERQNTLERHKAKLSSTRVLFINDSTIEELPQAIENLKLLRYLSLSASHNLQVLPMSILRLLNLQTLDLSDCEQLMELPIRMLSFLRLRHLLLSVKHSMFPEVVMDIPVLHHLKVCNCQNLESLPEGIASLASLRVLQIHDCPSIASLPNNIKCLTSLKQLSILNCQILDLTEWSGLDGLTDLQLLHFQGLPKLSEFPAGLQSAGDSLQHLAVNRCENLRVLPDYLQECTKLLVISIDSCPNMVTLPRGINAVNTLQVLRLINCPTLVARCLPDRGEDWDLISHIPILQLDNQVIQPRTTSILTQHKDDDPPHPSTSQGKGHMQLVAGSSVPSPSKLSSSSSLVGFNLNVQQVILDTKGPPSPPPPPLFHYMSTPNSILRVRGSHSLDSQGTTSESNKEGKLDKQKTEVEQEAKESECEKTSDELKELKIPSKEIESFSKGILFLFSEGYEFEKEMLIQLWMAEGFIKNEPMEINGSNYFEVLMSDGYILQSDSNSLYKVNNEKLNSNLAMILAKSNYLRLESTSQTSVAPADVLHVSVVCDDMDLEIFRKLEKFNSLRTLLFLDTYGSKLQQLPVDFFLSFEYLLVLDLSGTDIKELPISITKMIYLRYLDLSWTSIELLPETLSRFRQLQTLKLKGCSRLRRLPKEMRRLAELRHLDFNILGQLVAMPREMGVLKNLRTLSAFLVGTQEGCTITELRDLNNLAGEFCIARLENVHSGNEAEIASLNTKKQLKKLELRWSDFPLRELKNKDDDNNVLKHLCPHLSLEELQIRCYGGTNLPIWIADESFHKLTSITLFKCENVSMLPSMQKLPSLEYLELVSLNSVICVDVRGEMDCVAFPKLRKLVIDEMLDLVTWTEAEEGDFPCLVEFVIKDCPKLRLVPSILYFCSMKHIEISCCPQIRLWPQQKLSSLLEFLVVEDCPLIKESWDMIKHVPNVWIDEEEFEEPTDEDPELLDQDRETDDVNSEELFSV